MPDPDAAIRPSATRHPPPAWRPWRSKIVWGLAAGAVALRAVASRSSPDGHAVFPPGVRAFNRRWANPVILRIAGRSPWGVTRLEHRGRGSGSLYVTPVWSDPVSEGFLIPLPYGTDVDWATNLRHSGEGVLQRQGVRYRVGRPRIVPAADALPELPPLTRRLAGPYGIRDFLRVDVLPSLTAEVSPPA